jgi:O-antigen ligase
MNEINPEFDADAVASPSFDAQPEESSGVVVSVVIWSFAAVLGGAMILLKLPLIAMAVFGLATLVQVLLKPTSVIYILLLVIPIDWLVTIPGEYTGVAKLLAILAVVVCFPRLIRSIGAKWDPIAKWMLLFLGWGLITGLWAKNTLACLIAWQQIALVWALVWLICLVVKTPRALKLAMAVYLIGCVICAMTFIVSTDIRDMVDESGSRATPMAIAADAGDKSSEDINIVSRYLAVGLFAAMFLTIKTKGLAAKIVWPACLLLMAAGVILTKGRAVYVAVPAALIASVIFASGAGLLKRLALVLVIALFVGASFVAMTQLGLLGEGIQERFASIAKEGTSAGSRITIWKGHLHAFVSSGFMGLGLGQTRWLPETLYHVAHNDIIQVLGELGLIGITAFLGLLITVFVRLRRMHDFWTKVICLMLFFFIFFAGMTETDLVRKCWAIPIGLIVAAIRIEEAQRQEQAQQLSEFEGQVAELPAL